VACQSGSNLAHQTEMFATVLFPLRLYLARNLKTSLGLHCKIIRPVFCTRRKLHPPGIGTEVRVDMYQTSCYGAPRTRERL